LLVVISIAIVFRLRPFSLLNKRILQYVETTIKTRILFEENRIYRGFRLGLRLKFEINFRMCWFFLIWFQVFIGYLSKVKALEFTS